MCGVAKVRSYVLEHLHGLLALGRGRPLLRLDQLDHRPAHLHLCVAGLCAEKQSRSRRKATQQQRTSEYNRNQSNSRRRKAKTQVEQRHAAQEECNSLPCLLRAPESGEALGSAVENSAAQICVWSTLCFTVHQLSHAQNLTDTSECWSWRGLHNNSVGRTGVILGAMVQRLAHLHRALGAHLLHRSHEGECTTCSDGEVLANMRRTWQNQRSLSTLPDCLLANFLTVLPPPTSFCHKWTHTPQRTTFK